MPKWGRQQLTFSVFWKIQGLFDSVVPSSQPHRRASCTCVSEREGTFLCPQVAQQLKSIFKNNWVSFSTSCGFIQIFSTLEEHDYVQVSCSFFFFSFLLNLLNDICMANNTLAVPSFDFSALMKRSQSYHCSHSFSFCATGGHVMTWSAIKLLTCRVFYFEVSPIMIFFFPLQPILEIFRAKKPWMNCKS